MRNTIAQHSSRFVAMILVVASLFPLIAAYRYPAFLNDDSYITLTYAKNLANGNGFVFNHSPAVLGTTTPLFTVAVAGFALIFRQVDIPTVAVFLTAFCWLGIVWTFFFFRKEWGLADWQAGVVGLVVIASGWIGFLGMEAYPFAFLLVLSLSLFLSERYWLAGFVTGALFLTRGEGVLILGVILIAATVQHWHRNRSIDVVLARKILKLIVGFAAPVLLWFTYAYFTFGSFLPNTLAAKQAQGQNGLGRSFLTRLVNEWAPSWGNAFAIEASPYLNLWWVVTLLGALEALLRRRRWLIFAGWLILYTSGYILLNVSAYWWYQLPILFVLNLFFGLGIVTIIETLIRHIKPLSLSITLSVLLASLLIVVLAKPTISATVSYQGDARGESYTALSRWFREHTEGTESVASMEIGYLGYYTENRIVDLAGLIMPDIVPHVAERDFAWGFWHYKPDYYIYLSDFDWALASITADPRFEQEYQPVATLRGPRETDFVIYQRIDK